nr:MAG TPA: hypothetical protein [Bacteriophage sp.]
MQILILLLQYRKDLPLIRMIHIILIISYLRTLTIL